MGKLQKVWVLSVIAGALIIGGLYLQGDGRGNFSEAMEQMQNMQSRIIADNLTDADLDKLKKTYDDAKARRTKFETWRTADETKIGSTFTAYGLQTALFNQLKDTIRAPRETYLNGSTTIAKISTILPSWTTIDGESDSIAKAFKFSTKTTKQADYENLQKLSKSVNDLSHDIGLMASFISSYETIRPRLCTTNDATNDVAVLGTVTMYVGGAQIKDVCDGNNIKQVTCSRNKVTLGSDNKPVATSTLCPNTCGNGICLGAMISGNLDINTVTGESATKVKTGQEFKVKVPGVSMTPAAAYVLNLNPVPAGCTAPTTSINVSAATTSALYFEWITCSTTGAKTFSVGLKNADGQYVSTKTVPVTVESNLAERMEISVPSTITANTPFTAVVTVYGGNNSIFTNYTKGFYISLIGAGNGTVFPEGEQAFVNGTKSVEGLVFDSATTGTNKYTIKVTAEDRSLEKEIEVTVAQ